MRIFCLLFALVGFCQTKGKIKGVALDGEYDDKPLPFVNVFVEGTSKGVVTDMDGKFELSLEPGSYTLVFSYMGYATQKLENTSVVGGKTTSVSLVMEAEGNLLGEVVISDVARKVSETALLIDQKKAVEMKVAIGADEISGKGISDVATAVTKISGISKQEGSGKVFVRGLGDRYNITTLNGLPIPSDNPQTKNIDLNIFSTDIVDNIGISKVFNHRNYGDFSGANIDIVPKTHSGDSYIKFSVGGGINGNVMSADGFYLRPGPGALGFYNHLYAPDVLNRYTLDSWDKETVGGLFDKSFAINGGHTLSFGESRLGIFVTAGHDNDLRYIDGISRGSVNKQGVIFKDFEFKRYNQNTNSTAMMSVILNLNSKNKFKFTSLYINSSQHSYQDYTGIINVFDNATDGGGHVLRSEFDRTGLIVNQLLGDHLFADRWKFKWGVGYNISKNIIPNRAQNTIVPRDNDDFNKGLVPSPLAASDNNRFYQDLQENEFAVNTGLDYGFRKIPDRYSVNPYRGLISFGYSSRIKDVDFNSTQINVLINRSVNHPSVNIDNLDAYFNQKNIDAGYFKMTTFRGVVPNALEPQIYGGYQDVNSFFGSVKYRFNDRLSAVLGLRSDIINQFISWKTQLDPSGDNNDYSAVEILPELSLKYAVDERQNIKFSTSKTYTLPQFKERAPFQFQYVTRVEFGNPNLYSSTNYNADLKWEFFPRDGELVSLTTFGKYIQNPINSMVVASATNDISFVNTGDMAMVFGAEFDFRKTLYSHSPVRDGKLSLGFNMSYMFNHQNFDNDKVDRETDLSVFFTNDKGSLTGASNLLINADLSYKLTPDENRSFLTTLVFNYFSDKLYAIGTSGKGDQVDKPVPSLDFITKLQISRRINFDFSIKNILNPRVVRLQDSDKGSIELLSYKKGINAGISVKYKL